MKRVHDVDAKLDAITKVSDKQEKLKTFGD
jgi:hypothetical protein